MTKKHTSIRYNYLGGVFMYVRIFDENHELDLEKKINDFLKGISDEKIIDIKYQISTLYDYKEQIYCYSALIIYDY